MQEHASALLISDLHLTPSMPLTAQRFFDFVEKEANQVESVFILGDLFEYWVGDDAGARSPFQQEVLRALSRLSSKAKTYYIHGNRDFLIGEQFIRKSGMTLLPDPSKVMIAGDEWVISHGDALCTNDLSYQIFRKWVRKPWLQNLFLRLPLEWRRYPLSGDAVSHVPCELIVRLSTIVRFVTPLRWLGSRVMSLWWPVRTSWAHIAQSV